MSVAPWAANRQYIQIIKICQPRAEGLIKLGPVNTKEPTVKIQIFPKGKAQGKIGRKRIEHTVRSIFLLQHSHLEKGGFAAGKLVLTDPRAFNL